MATANFNEPTSAATGNIPFIGAEPGDNNDGTTLRESFKRVNARLKEIFGAQNSSNVVQTPFVDADNIKDNLISGQSQMTGDVEDGDELMVSDGGTIKRAGFSVVRDAVFNDVSGDATIAAGGALTIENGAVENAMLADNAVDHDELAARYTEKAANANSTATTSIDASTKAIFDISLQGDHTLRLEGYKTGQVIDILLDGDQAPTLSSRYGTATFNKVGSTLYDGSSSQKNVLQILCLNDDPGSGTSAVNFLYAVSTYEDNATPAD